MLSKLDLSNVTLNAIDDAYFTADDEDINDESPDSCKGYTNSSSWVDEPTRFFTPPPTDPPEETLPKRPYNSVLNSMTEVLDRMTRETLIEALRDAIDHIPGPLPSSLQNILLREEEAKKSMLLSKTNSDLASTEVDPEEMIELAVPNYEELIPSLGKKIEPRIYNRRSSLTSRLRRLSAATELPPIPETAPPLPYDHHLQIPPRVEVLPEFSSSVPISTKSIESSPSNEIASFQFYSESFSASILASPFSVTSGDQQSFDLESVQVSVGAHHQCSNELAHIELYLAGNLGPDANGRFIPSIYVTEMPCSDSDSSEGVYERFISMPWFKESLPIKILSTAGYSEEECEVYLRAQCLRTGVIGICRLSQTIPSEVGDDMDRICLENAHKKLWKLHPL